MHKNLATLSVLVACIYGCKEPVVNKSAAEKKETATPPETDTMISVKDTIEATKIDSWQSFAQFDGKYALEVDLLGKEPLKTRIRQLLDKDHPSFIDRFQVTPPVEVENTILYNQGCRPHNCGIEESALAVDMSRDVIYAGIATNGIVKLYSEKNDSAYPDKLLRWKLKFIKN